MADLLPVIKQRFCDSNNNPLVGGKLFSYIAGTSTPKVTYRDYEGTANTNPIILDANGECDLRIATGMYKFILKNSNDVTIWSVDKVSQPNLAGNGVPGGGLEGQVLKKVSNDDFELEWGDLDKDDVGLGNVDNTSDATKNSATATLTNKTFGDAATFTQIATPTNPAAGKNKVYAKADGQFYNLNDAGVETPLGSGSGGGSKNYLGTVNLVNGNGNFELGSTAKWSLFNTTLTNKIPTGAINSGAASITTFAASFTNRIAGNFSLWVKSTGALAVGEGFISDAFTLDLEDLGKVLTTSFYYQLTGSGLVGAGNSNNTFAFYLYDVANGQWVQPSGVYSMSQLNNIGLAQGQFQTATTAISYRLAVVCINASSGATDLRFDDFAISPSQYVYGTPVTESALLSIVAPASLGTLSQSSLFMSRVGDRAKIKGQIRVGTTTAATAYIQLPFNVDSSKMTAGTNQNRVGFYQRFATSSTAVDQLTKAMFWDGATANQIFFTSDTGTTANQFTKQNGNTLFNANDYIWIDIEVPVLGWSSSVQMSDSADTRVVSFVGNTITTQAVTANVTNVNLNAVRDSHGAWAGAVYNVPVPGDYNFDIWMGITSAALLDMNVYVDGVLALKGATSFVSSSANLVGSGVIPNLRAGQQISFRLDVSNTISSSLIRTISISKISGPSAIAATETIAARYTSTAGNAIGTSAAVLAFVTKTFDTHGAYATGTGLFTCPAQGKYEAIARFATAAVTLSTTNSLVLYVYKNGALYSEMALLRGNGASNSYSINGSDIIDCVAGDTLAIYALSSVATTVNTGTVNYINFRRVG